MKKTIGILSLAVLLFSTFAPTFTYATEAEDEAKQILTETLDETMNEFDESHDVAEIEEYNVDSRNTYETDDEWNTATLTTNNDGSKTLVRNDINVTIAGEDLGEYYWGFDTPVGESERNETTSTSGDEFNDIWGGKDDSVPNGFDSGLNSKRRGPCGEGWHVPSRGERSELMIAWCHLSTNNCSENKIVHLSYYNANYKNIYLYLNGVTPKLYEDFNFITKRQYRSSTPYYSTQAYYFYTTAGTQYDGAYSDTTNGRNGVWQNGIYFPGYVRCFKDYYPPKEITFNANGGEIVGESTLTTENGVVTLPNATKTEDRNGEYILEGWFESEGESNKIGNPGEIVKITEEKTLYAHRLQTITVTDPTNVLIGMTILDRNLGATEAGTGINSYGFHYQWGNNYGFLQNETINKTGTRAKWNDNYSHSNYSDPYFRYGNRLYDYWENEQDTNGNKIYHDGLWGGENDNEANNRGLDIIEGTSGDRRGPCPEGWHVPSIGERSKLIRVRTSLKYRGAFSTGNYGNILQHGKLEFQEYFKLPWAGRRYEGDGTIMYTGSYGVYWSSTPRPNNDYVNRIWIDQSSVYTANSADNRSRGLSVRCFKNQYIPYTLKLKLEGGVMENSSEDEIVYTVGGGKNLSDYIGTTPSKEGYVFQGWYNEETQEKIEKNYKINSNLILTAKRDKNPKYIYNGNGGKFGSGLTTKTIVAVNNDKSFQLNNSGHRYEIYKKMLTITGASSLHVEGTRDAGYIDYFFIYDHDISENEGEVYKKYSRNCGQYGCQWDINLDIIGDTIGILSYSGIYGSGPEYNLTVTPKGWKNYSIEDIDEIPSREGYNFIGWFEEGENTPFDFTGTEVTQDRTFYAKWDKIGGQSQSAGGGSINNKSKQEDTELEHNSADTEKATEEDNKETKPNQTTNTPAIQEQVKKVEGKGLTRGEVAVMTDILLEVYPQLTEGREMKDVTKACSSYVDEQNFTKDEKKAITRLCRLSIMGIHKDTKEPLDEFLVRQKSTNGEFATVMNRVVENYNEIDLSSIKEALKKLEGNEENVMFGTLYEIFINVKELLNK